MNAHSYSGRIDWRSIGILVPLLVAWGAAHAEEWMPVSKTVQDGQQIDVLVETPMIRIEGDIRDTATKREYPLQTLQDGQAHRFVIDVWHFDCRRRMSQLIALESQRPDGATISMTAHQDKSTWRSADTAWPPKEVLDFVCSWEPPKSTT